MPTRTTNIQSEDTDINESSQRSQSTWGLVAGASLISTGLAAYEIVPASVTPLIRDSLNIGPTTAGLLVGIMFGTAVITSLPAGAVLDRTNTRNAMAVAVIILFLAGIWGWMAGRSGDYRAVIASRAVGGVAYVVVWNAGIDIVSRSVDESRRALLLACSLPVAQSDSHSVRERVHSSQRGLAGQRSSSRSMGLLSSD